MKCEKFIDRFLELDDYSFIPFFLKIHMLMCHKCFMEARLMMEEMYRLNQLSSYELDRNITHDIMINIKGKTRIFGKRVSNPKWILGGVLIFFSIVLVTFSHSFVWIKNFFGVGYIVPMNIVMGIILTIYAIIFVGSTYKSMYNFLNLFVRRTDK